MVQARQVATFAQAARRGISDAGEKALQVLDGALDRFSEGDLSSGVAFSVTGRRLEPVRDAYTHAFALFALAAALHLSGERRYRVAIEHVLGFVDGALADPIWGGLKDRWPHPSAGKAQNPTMHLLEAYLALHEAWPERGFLDRAARLVALAETHLVDPTAAAILEHYADDWRPRPASPEGAFFEPGHQFEWAWLITRYVRLAGADERPIADRLWRTATGHGFDAAGFCIDSVGTDFAPLQRSRRLWPHCEAARAALTRPDGDAVLASALQRLNADFLGRPFPAGWIDRLDARGEPALDFVPASSLYHLYGTWAQLAEY